MENEFALNAEHYQDPTAGKALANIESQERAKKLFSVLLYIIKTSGFELEERIQIRDRRTGKIYK